MPVDRSWKRPFANLYLSILAIPLGPGAYMLPIESSTQIFIIRIWLEEIADNDKPALWRGRLIHVPSGESQHFNNMQELIDLMREHLQAINIDI